MHSFTGPGTEAMLRAFAKSIRGISSVLGMHEQFSSLLGTLFPNAPETAVLQRGSETSLNILNSAGEAKRGSADTVCDNAVIDFERDLKKTGEHAHDQLRDYVAACGNGAARRHLREQLLG